MGDQRTLKETPGTDKKAETKTVKIFLDEMKMKRVVMKLKDKEIFRGFD